MQGLDVVLPKVSVERLKRQVSQDEHFARTFGVATVQDHRQQTSTWLLELGSLLFARMMSVQGVQENIVSARSRWRTVIVIGSPKSWWHFDLQGQRTKFLGRKRLQNHQIALRGEAYK